MSPFLHNQHLFQTQLSNLASDCNPVGQLSLNKRSMQVKQHSLWTKFLNLDKMLKDLLILDEVNETCESEIILNR